MTDPKLNKEYHLWRDGEYIGKAIYRDDPNHGECFLKLVEVNGRQVNQVFFADKWELVDENAN